MVITRNMLSALSGGFGRAILIRLRRMWLRAACTEAALRRQAARGQSNGSMMAKKLARETEEGRFQQGPIGPLAFIWLENIASVSQHHNSIDTDGTARPFTLASEVHEK